MMEGGVPRHPVVRRGSGSGHIQNQYEDMRERNRILRQKVQSLQGDRDNAAERMKQMWQKMEHLNKEKAELQKQLQRVTTPAGKGKVLWANQDAMAERVEAVTSQNQRLHAKYTEDMKNFKCALEEADQDREGLRYKLSERQRQYDKLSEKLACLGPNYDTSKKQVDDLINQRDKYRKQVSELEKELKALKERLVQASAGKGGVGSQVGPSERESADLKVELSYLKQDLQAAQQKKEKLAEENKEMRVAMGTLESRNCGLELECQRLRECSPVRQLDRLGERSLIMRGSSEDLRNIRRGQRSSLGPKKFSPNSVDSDSDRSLQDLTSLTYTGGLLGANKKLSSSTSNLQITSEANSRLRSKLLNSDPAVDDLRRDNINLMAKVTELEQERVEREGQLKRTKHELQMAQVELNKSASHYQEAKCQIQALSKEKGVAMRDNAVSYQQSIQLETKLKELQAERQIIEQKRNIANREREKVVTESVSLKKKLEQIKAQRQKDAKELVAMKLVKDKAVSDVSELRRSNQQLKATLSVMEGEMGQIRESLTHATMKLGLSGRGRSPGTTSGGKAPGLAQDLHVMLERLQNTESERKLLHKRLFGSEAPDSTHPATMGDVLHKVERLFHERDELVLEIEALQSSSNKLNEERIFDLKQRIEDLMMERDTLTTQVKHQQKEISSLSAKLISTEQEKDKLSIEVSRLGLQCQQLKSTQERVVEEHSKTLDRINDLWKQKWPGAYDEQAWEEKQITLQLGSDGLAGFSVVGGRDQPQLPNPGALIVTTVNSGSPADGQLKVGDILEAVNGQSLSNSDHREVVRAVKESKGTLSVVVRRRRHAHPLVVGIVSAVNSVPHIGPNSAPKAVEHQFSLLIPNKESLGFRYDWMSTFKITEVIPNGPANQILEVGDRILRINGHSVSREKASAIKKLLKPHKNILQLTIERSKKTNNDTGQAMSPFHAAGWSEDGHESRSSMAPSSSSTPTYRRRTQVSTTTQSQSSPSLELESKASGYSSSIPRERERDTATYQLRDRESYSSSNRDSFSQDTQSQDSESKPTKLVSMVTQVKRDPTPNSAQPRPVSDGAMHGNFNERRIEYEDVLLSERTGSQYSQSESYLSESSYGDYGLSSSQSIDLTFHSVSTVTHNRLTVDTMAPTQNEPSSGRRGYAEEEEEFFDRLDATRNTFRTRPSTEGNSNTNNSQSQDDCGSSSQLSDTQCSQEALPSVQRRDHKHYKRRHMKSRRKSNSMHGSRSLTKLSSPEDRSSSLPRVGATGSAGMGMRGRSWSNLSLSHAPSMTSVMEEPRRSTSTTNVSDTLEQDPLADAAYIRANFTYVPRSPKELYIKAGDVFHIHDEAPPERFRASFWVSRLNSDGTDEQIGAIPNSLKAQQYLAAQGESLDIPIYEEVEAYTGMRPVLVFGALADQVVSSLMESYRHMFYSCRTELQPVEGTARITEARLKREVGEGNIIDFCWVEDGYEVIRLDALNGKENKSKHCLMPGTIQAFQSLKSIAPPITILIKAMAEESIMTFSPEQMPAEEAKRIYEEVVALEEQYGYEFSASLFLIYMHTLLGQIEDIVKREKRKQSWVSVTRET